MARETGLERSSLNTLLLGRRKGLPHRKTIEVLARYLECDPVWLKTGKGERGRVPGESVTGFDESLNVTFSQIRQWLLDEHGEGTISIAMDFADEFQAAFPRFRDWKSAQRIIKNPEKSGVEPVKA